MLRVFLALLVLALVVGAMVALVRSVTSAFGKSGGTDLVSTGSAMQKVSFFLLLCLMMYVSVSGMS